MAYKYYFIFRREWFMKEIGEKLRETRESMGITIEEAANDLKLRPSQIENIEQGNKEAFKDIWNKSEKLVQDICYTPVDFFGLVLWFLWF